jgi:hypothetical protein
VTAKLTNFEKKHNFNHIPKYNSSEQRKYYVSSTATTSSKCPTATASKVLLATATNSAAATTAVPAPIDPATAHAKNGRPPTRPAAVSQANQFRAQQQVHCPRHHQEPDFRDNRKVRPAAEGKRQWAEQPDYKAYATTAYFYYCPVSGPKQATANENCHQCK